MKTTWIIRNLRDFSSKAVTACEVVGIQMFMAYLLCLGVVETLKITVLDNSKHSYSVQTQLSSPREVTGWTKMENEMAVRSRWRKQNVLVPSWLLWSRWSGKMGWFPRARIKILMRLKSSFQWASAPPRAWPSLHGFSICPSSVDPRDTW